MYCPQHAANRNGGRLLSIDIHKPMNNKGYDNNFQVNPPMRLAAGRWL